MMKRSCWLVVLCAGCLTILYAEKSILFRTIASSNDVRRALEEGSVDVNEYNEDGLTPLMVAAQQSDAELARLLLKHGARVDMRSTMRDKTLEDILVQRGYRKTDPSIKVDNNTALHYACFYEDFEIINELLEYGADPNAVNNYGETPLHILVNYDNFKERKELMRLFVARGARINNTNIDGDTFLHLAIRQNNNDWLRFMTNEFLPLIDFGVKNNEGLTLAGLAKQLLYSDTELIIENAYTKQQSAITDSIELPNRINGFDDEGYTQLMRASMRGDKANLERLLKAGADSSLVSKNSDAITALHGALRYNHVVEALLLLNQGAPLAPVDARGDAPLHYVRYLSDVDDKVAFVQAVAAQEGDLNKLGSKGTIVHDAIRLHADAWLKRLLQQFGKKIDLSVQDKDGKTVLALAMLVKNEKAVVLLKKE